MYESRVLKFTGHLRSAAHKFVATHRLKFMQPLSLSFHQSTFFLFENLFRYKLFSYLLHSPSAMLIPTSLNGEMTKLRDKNLFLGSVMYFFLFCLGNVHVQKKFFFFFFFRCKVLYMVLPCHIQTLPVATQRYIGFETTALK